ncbi:MAG: hypothetical protein ACRDRO_04475 [Pseudonocardiaceae bacterium]
MALRQQQRLSQRREAVALTRKSLAQRHSDQAEMWLGRTEFEELIRPPLARTVEALRSDIEIIPTPVPATAEARGLAGCDVRAPAQTEVPKRPVPQRMTTIPPGSAEVRGRQGAPWRFTRFAAAGLLALVGGAASVPLMTSHSGSITGVAVGNPAPAAPGAAIPAADLGSNPHGENSSGAPVAAPNDDPVPSSSAAVRTPQPQTIRNASRSRPPVIRTARPAPRAPAIPPDAYAAWSRLAELSASNQDGTRFRPEAAPRP